MSETGKLADLPKHDVYPSEWVTTRARLLDNGRLVGKRHHYAVVEVDEPMPVPRAGQFYMLAPGEARESMLLRRPMSVARAWREGNTLRLGFLYTVAGRGTRALAESPDRWEILGPLGNGYPEPEGGPAILVAGGRGIAPLVLLIEQLVAQEREVVLLNGAREESELCAPAELGAPDLSVWLLERESTEDGSRGTRGRVLDLLEDPDVAAIASKKGATFYSCGPHGLLRAVGEAAHGYGAKAWVAVESHMACGVGICRSCVLPRADDAVPGPCATNAKFLLACLDGPVLEASEVDWERAL